MSHENLKPGQKYATPTPGFGDRVFYETLFRQRPDSFMAQEWCVNYGVLPSEEAAKLYKVLLKRKAKEKAGGGSSSNSSPSKKRKVTKKSSGKGIEQSVRYDAGMSAGGDEGLGTMGL